MKLCGIDSSTSATSISLFNNGDFIDYKLIELDKKKYPTQWDRINPMIYNIITVLNEYKPDVIYQEDSWKGRNVDTLKCLTNILGGVRSWSLFNECEYYQITPSAWRKELGLNEYKAERNELKKKAMDYIKDKYDIVVPTDDVSDCICIGLAGLQIYDR